jgi:hypothetical protein
VAPAAFVGSHAGLDVEASHTDDLTGDLLLFEALPASVPACFAWKIFAAAWALFSVQFSATSSNMARSASQADVVESRQMP